MEREAREATAGGGDAARSIERAEVAQERLRGVPGGRGRGIEPEIAVGRGAGARAGAGSRGGGSFRQGGQREGGVGQVLALDLGELELEAAVVVVARVQPEQRPARVRPARPARCAAEARLTLRSSSRGSPDHGE